MIRRVLPGLIALLSLTNLSAAPPSNAVTITNRAGIAETNHPFTISRVFAQGEILQFAQARVNGTPVTSQCDVKTRWSDGSLKHAIISFVANMPASGTVTVDFVNQTSGNNTGAMDRTAMLAANWGAQIEVTNGSTLTASARQILTDWAGTSADKRVTYWLQGPICTQVILEDRSATMAYDIGFNATKSLHPIFVATFYPQYPQGVKVEMILENAWTTKLQDQAYSLALKTGNPLNSIPVYTKALFTHLARSRWRKVFWSGTTPVDVHVNPNLAYMIYTKILPNWDLSITTTSSAITNDINRFNSGDKGDINGVAFWTQYQSSADRPELGIMPAWYLRWLYTGDPRLYDVMMGNAAVAGYVPIHYRESLTGRFYDSANTVDALGRALSINARPSVYLLNQTAGNGADLISPVGPASWGGWGLDLAHEPDMSFVPYLVTGDWYWLEELYFTAGSDLATPNPSNCFYCRHGNWGYFPYAAQTRGQAWGLRNVAHAAIAAPDNTPEKAYFTEKLNNNIAVEEGNQNVLSGVFYQACTSNPYNENTEASKWCWGRKTIGENVPNPLHFMNKGDVSLDGAALFVSPTDPYAVERQDAPWMYAYKYCVLGHMEELGFSAGPLNNTQFGFLLNMLQNPAFNPFLVEIYKMPVARASTGTYYQTWSDFLLAFTTSWTNAFGTTYNLRTANQWTASSVGNYSDPGYAHMMRGAASFLAGRTIGGLSGDAAWNWISANVSEGAAGANQSYVFIPRVTVSPSSQCDVNKDGTVNSLDVQLITNQALGTAACATDLDQNGKCDVIDVQRVINASLGQTCRVGP